MTKEIAFFDFDGTITTKDTMIALVKFYKGGKEYYKGLLKLLPYLAGMKLKLVTNTYAKEKLLGYFFGGMSIHCFNQLCDDFMKKVLPQLIRPGALQTINELQQKGIPVIVVTASADNWVRGWCDANNITCLASCLEIKDDKVTGKLNGENCHSHEKVKRIQEKYNLTEYSTVYCYGDTKGDKPMLQLATHSFYKPFRHLNS